MNPRTLFFYHGIFAAPTGDGNSSWVVPKADGLNDAQMGEIATLLAASATAFLSSESGPDNRIRFFSATGEFDLCGHAVVTAVCTLAGLEIVPSTPEPQGICLQTATGEFRDETSCLRPGMRHCAMSQQKPWFKSTPVNTRTVAERIGHPANDM